MVNLNLGPPAMPAPVAQAPQKMEVGQDTHITVKPAKFAVGLVSLSFESGVL